MTTKQSLDSITDGRIDSALRRLDAAPQSAPLTAPEQHRADDLRARIMADETEGNALTRSPAASAHLTGQVRRSPVRWVAVGGAVAAITAALLVLPQLGSEDQRTTAWSATPTALAGDTARELGDRCLTVAQERYERDAGADLGLPDGVQSPPAGSFDPAQRKSMRIVLGERRGPFDFVLLGNASGYELSCSSPATDRDVLVSGGEYPLSAPAADSVTASGQAESQPDGAQGTAESSMTAIYGRVGHDVRAVTVSTPAGAVTATVKAGWFAATWPRWDGAPEDPFANVTITLTLADGSRTPAASFDSLNRRDDPIDQSAQRH